MEHRNTKNSSKVQLQCILNDFNIALNLHMMGTVYLQKQVDKLCQNNYTHL